MFQTPTKPQPRQQLIRKLLDRFISLRIFLISDKLSLNIHCKKLPSKPMGMIGASKFIQDTVVYPDYRLSWLSQINMSLGSLVFCTVVHKTAHKTLEKESC